jgi:hypothetical protein
VVRLTVYTSLVEISARRITLASRTGEWRWSSRADLTGDYTNPKRTLTLLDALVEAAGSEIEADEVFAFLHHRDNRIKPHRDYCAEKVDRFLIDENSARVQHRLEWILKFYYKARLSAGEKNALKALAVAAYETIPPVPWRGNTFERWSIDTSPGGRGRGQSSRRVRFASMLGCAGASAIVSPQAARSARLCRCRLGLRACGMMARDSDVRMDMTPRKFLALHRLSQWLEKRHLRACSAGDTARAMRYAELIGTAESRMSRYVMGQVTTYRD